MNDCRPLRALVGHRPIPRLAGVGLRPAHYEYVIEQRPAVAWFEVHAENQMTGSDLNTNLREIVRDYPLSLHSVGLSLGSTSPPEPSHLASLLELVTALEPDLVSDHLSWSAVDGVHLPDLLPLPYTAEALGVVIRNIHAVQAVLRRRLLIENPSRYIALPQSTMSEAQFLSEVVLRTGCGILLDVNNVYVTAANTGVSALALLRDFFDQVSPEDVAEIHLAGHTVVPTRNGDTLLVDDHGSRVCREVWQLFETAVLKCGPVPTLIEWDTRLPSFETLQAEAAVAQAILSHDVTEERYVGFG